MAGEMLHEFDLALCNYVLGNVRPLFNSPVLADRLRAQLAPGLPRYLRGMDEGDARRLLLNDEEFDFLVLAIEDCLDGYFHDWVPYRELHARHVGCVREIRDTLTKETAEVWVRDSLLFAKRLEDEKLCVEGGIEIVHEWVDALRKLLGAMGSTAWLPYPDGTFPTPTSPASLTGSPTPSSLPYALTALDRRDIERMRQAIVLGVNGKNTMPDTLVRKAGINKQRGRRALRRLEELGEYDGFRREQAERYKEGRPNET